MVLPLMPLYPGLMVPPYTIRAGLFRRAIAMTTPGIFLSHPGSEMFASYHCTAHHASAHRIACRVAKQTEVPELQ